MNVKNISIALLKLSMEFQPLDVEVYSLQDLKVEICAESITLPPKFLSYDFLKRLLKHFDDKQLVITEQEYKGALFLLNISVHNIIQILGVLYGCDLLLKIFTIFSTIFFGY